MDTGQFKSSREDFMPELDDTRE